MRQAVLLLLCVSLWSAALYMYAWHQGHAQTYALCMRESEAWSEDSNITDLDGYCTCIEDGFRLTRHDVISVLQAKPIQFDGQRLDAQIPICMQRFGGKAS